MSTHTLALVPADHIAVLQTAALYGPIGTALYTTYAGEERVSQVRDGLYDFEWLDSAGWTEPQDEDF